jgi:hypothetical protein
MLALLEGVDQSNHETVAGRGSSRGAWDILSQCSFSLRQQKMKLRRDILHMSENVDARILGSSPLKLYGGDHPFKFSLRS